jgi:Zn finger protein HypA/HybF involved in hydrogenase expression
MTWDKVGGTGLWQEYENQDTGEKSIKEHKLKLVKQWCAKGQHDYTITGNREATCSKCDSQKPFIVGKHTITGNKVIID